MGKKEWVAIVIIVLLSNAATLFVTSKYLIQKPKTVDVAGILEGERMEDIKKVLAGEMSKEDFEVKHKAIAGKLEALIDAEGGTIYLQQCILGTKHEDITDRIKIGLKK